MKDLYHIQGPNGMACGVCGGSPCRFYGRLCSHCIAAGFNGGAPLRRY